MPKPLEETLRGLSTGQQEEFGKMLVEFTGRAMQSLVSTQGFPVLAYPNEKYDEIANAAVAIAFATTLALVRNMED